jgi:hypothetical protein
MITYVDPVETTPWLGGGGNDKYLGGSGIDTAIIDSLDEYPKYGWKNREIEFVVRQ